MKARELASLAKDKVTGADRRCWDIARDGRMADFAVEPEDEIVTVPYEPGTGGDA